MSSTAATIVVREEGGMIWRGAPSAHSGAYHIILCQTLDGEPLQVKVENPDSMRFDIPGVMDSGWDPKTEDVLCAFFEAGRTHRPQEGFFFNLTEVSTAEELRKQLDSFFPSIAALVDDPELGWEPELQARSKDAFIDLAIYRRDPGTAKGSASAFESLGYSGPEELVQLGAQLAELMDLMQSGEKSFVQIVAVKEYGLNVRGMIDVLSWWLWGPAQVAVRRFGE